MLYGMGVPASALRLIGRWTVERSLAHDLQRAMLTQIMNKPPRKLRFCLPSCTASFQLACLFLQLAFLLPSSGRRTVLQG